MAFGEMTQRSNAQTISFYDRPVKNAASFRGESVTKCGNIVLDSLPAGMRRELEPFLESVALPKEEFLFQEQDRLNMVYFPVTAVVSEFKMLDDGRMVEIAVTGKEGAIGLSSVLSDSHTASYYTQVSQAGTAKRINAAKLGQLLRSNERLHFSLSRHTDLYIRQISQKAICNMYHSVKERLCTWLLMVQDRSGRNKLSLTHDQISRILGVNRPSVSRMAHELRQSKFISYSRGKLSICDRKRVEASACTCYLELGGSGSMLRAA